MKKFTLPILIFFLFTSCGHQIDNSTYSAPIIIANYTDSSFYFDINPEKDQYPIEYADSIYSLASPPSSTVLHDYSWKPGDFYYFALFETEDNCTFVTKYSVKNDQNMDVYTGSMRTEVYNVESINIYIHKSPIKQSYSSEEMDSLISNISDPKDQEIILRLYNSYTNEEKEKYYSFVTMYASFENWTIDYHDEEYSSYLFNTIGSIFAKYNIEVNTYFLFFDECSQY